LQSHLEWARLW